MLTLENSIIKVKPSNQSTTTITDIEQWTTAFATYMSVFTHEFPNRAQELLQYMSLIRHAAHCHKGVGWCIYDVKFRRKAALDQSINWSELDQQLWLMISRYTKPHSKRNALFSTMDPNIMPPRGPKGASAGTSTGPAHVAEANANIAMSVTAVTGNTREIPVQVMKGPEEKKSFTQPEAIASPSKLNTSIINPLTPIFVSKFEYFLADHPDPTLVSQLCTNLRVGACIGFEGQRTPRFSKNLPTGLNQPSIVTSNLGHEVSLGRVAGPFEPHHFLISRSHQLA